MSTDRLRRSIRFAVAAALAVTGIAVTTDLGASTAEAVPLAVDLYDPTPRSLGPITVFGDSVLHGSFLYSPTVVDQLAARGWGPIRGRTGVGNSTNLSSNTASNATYWIDRWRSTGWDAPNVFINLGSNDSGHCRTNLTCARNAIMAVVNRVGPGHRIWWPKVTQYPYNIAWQHTWNAALDQIAGERPDFFTWDWPGAIVTHRIPMASDYIHSTPGGYRTRSNLMAAQITTDLARAKRVGPDAPLPTAIGAPAEYVALTPERVFDSRRDAAGPIAGGSQVVQDLNGKVPAGTTAVAVSLTSAGASGNGYLSGYPCDRTRREISNVNYRSGAARAAMAIVPISADGRLCVYTKTRTNVIIDLQGAFVPAGANPSALRMTPVNPPQRLLDTRNTGRSAVSVIPVPAGASAVAVNLTATNAAAAGWLKAWGCDAEPLVSNVNYQPGQAIASAAIVPVSPDGTICVRALQSTDLVVDITGVFRDDGALTFVAADPTRVLDTRSAIGGWAPIHGADQAIDVRAVPAAARAVTGTLTLVRPVQGSWLSAYNCGARPPTSNVNGPADDVLANAITVGVNASGRVCILTRASGHTLLDVTGWWVS